MLAKIASISVEKAQPVVAKVIPDAHMPTENHMSTENQERLLVHVILAFLGFEQHSKELVRNMFDCDVCLLASDDDWQEIGIGLGDAILIRVCDCCAALPPGSEIDPEPEPGSEKTPRVLLLKRLPCLIKGREVAASVKHPNDECQFCMDEFADTGLDGSAILQCPPSTTLQHYSQSILLFQFVLIYSVLL